ncbi:hypothetical protein [Pseudomonas fluorescens]|uniref:hypothetical protein n=1 Tax=Pseudomonas fluorescens TaxID=294 RepID=UPI0012D723BB|nr:hypothetical protein [Pseudomonas fluorescens]
MSSAQRGCGARLALVNRMKVRSEPHTTAHTVALRIIYKVAYFALIDACERLVRQVLEAAEDE